MSTLIAMKVTDHESKPKPILDYALLILLLKVTHQKLWLLAEILARASLLLFAPHSNMLLFGGSMQDSLGHATFTGNDVRTVLLLEHM
jgi:hypothetical protein